MADGQYPSSDGHGQSDWHHDPGASGYPSHDDPDFVTPDEVHHYSSAVAQTSFSAAFPTDHPHTGDYADASWPSSHGYHDMMHPALPAANEHVEQQEWDMGGSQQGLSDASYAVQQGYPAMETGKGEDVAASPDDHTDAASEAVHQGSANSNQSSFDETTMPPPQGAASRPLQVAGPTSRSRGRGNRPKNPIAAPRGPKDKRVLSRVTAWFDSSRGSRHGSGPSDSVDFHLSHFQGQFPDASDQSGLSPYPQHFADGDFVDHDASSQAAYQAVPYDDEAEGSENAWAKAPSAKAPSAKEPSRKNRSDRRK